MMDHLFQIMNAQSRSISPENLTGESGKGGMCPLEKGSARNAARELGLGWKVNPYLVVEPKSVIIMADICGSGVINHIWLTPTGRWRNVILRFYWDDQENPSVECPLGDFFCMGWNEYSQINSLAVCVNPGSGFNSYWQMPFKCRCRITLENIAEEPMKIFYQIDYTLKEHEGEIAYFHAQFRRVNPLPYKQVYTIVDGIRGTGQYVGGGEKERLNSIWMMLKIFPLFAEPGRRIIFVAPIISKILSLMTVMCHFQHPIRGYR